MDANKVYNLEYKKLANKNIVESIGHTLGG
jgi:hypothetical protein